MRRYKKVGFIKITDIWFDTQAFCQSEDAIVCLHSNDSIPSNLYQFKLISNTFILDISESPEKIFANFEYKSCRYPINKAKRDGIHVWKAVTEEEKRKYLEFQNCFCREKQIPLVSKEDVEQLEIYCAETPELDFLGGCAFLVSEVSHLVRYKYGATAHKLNANEAILWKAISDYHEMGFKWFDFGGCIPTEDKNSYYYRHYCFKKKFGGKLVESYTYFKMKSYWKGLWWVLQIMLKVFGKEDINGLIVELNKRGWIR